MKNDRTRELSAPNTPSGARGFLTRNRASLVVIEGPAAGTEYELDRPRLDLGRGPEVDLCFADDAMSREHVAFELVEDGFRVRDLGSTNGVVLNGGRVLAAELKHGDRLRVGEHTFQYLVERLERQPETYLLPDD